ncbi:replication protein [Tissierella praeacuta]|uniref:replication protein n=1 Tax=Tissierella praeacuta TaxID=43131 RepID=UPI0028A679A0|nr:replication protein [Tissierella praeacuta]
MRGPQLEDGYTRIANEILEVVSKVKFNGTQFKILMAIWRYTYGFNRKSSEFSLNFLSGATNSNKQQVKRELDRLIEDNIIVIEKEADFNTSRILSFNKNYSKWKVEGIQYVKKDTVSELEYSGVSELDYSTVSEKAYTTVSGLEYQERQYKEITTTAIGEMESPKNNLVADTDADSVQQDKDDNKKRIKDLQRIEDYYKREIRGKAVCGGTDLVNITNTYEKYKDVDFIISVMEKAKQDYISRYGKLEINSFNYFDSIFEERWRLLHAKKDEVKDKIPTNKNYNKKKVQAKKTKFHNFEGRTEKYTAEQLDDIAERKRREYSERLKKQNEVL